VIRIVMELSRDGRLTAPPRVVTTGRGPMFEAWRDSAVRAILVSQPFNMLRQETYETWQSIEVEFDEKLIFGR
jgi:hypothetical protein